MQMYASLRMKRQSPPTLGFMRAMLAMETADDCGMDQHVWPSWAKWKRRQLPTIAGEDPHLHAVRVAKCESARADESNKGFWGVDACRESAGLCS